MRAGRVCEDTVSRPTDAVRQTSAEATVPSNDLSSSDRTALLRSARRKNAHRDAHSRHAAQRRLFQLAVHVRSVAEHARSIGHSPPCDGDAILSAMINAAMLEVFLSQQCMRRKLNSWTYVSNCRNTRNSRCKRVVRFPYSTWCLYTSNMAACYVNHVSDVTAPRV